MAQRRKTDTQKLADKVEKSVKVNAKLVYDKFQYENFREPNAEERLLIYTDACKMAMPSLALNEQLILLDFYFLKGNKEFRGRVDSAVAEVLSNLHAYQESARTHDANSYSVLVGNNFYRTTVYEIKEMTMANLRGEMAYYLGELTEGVSRAKVLALRDRLSSMHLRRELGRKHVEMVMDEKTHYELYESYVEFKDVEDLTRCIVRDSIAKGLKAQLEGEKIQKVASEFEE